MARALALASVVGVAATPAHGQYIGGAAPPLPAAPRAGEIETSASTLARAVRTLAQSPRDFRALISAGRAAVDLGDMQAAIGFFGRAEEVLPSDPAPKIGMGAAMVASGDARGALAWFFRAQQLGASPAAIGADRGLAQDLLGNQAAAQQDYRAALAGSDRDEARRRLALSLGISGQREAAFVVLQPLLMRRDLPAQRVRAFVLALVGDERGASGAIDSAMPGTGARMAGFFRLLPSLSATQKAAAVHLGIFPDPNEIRVAALTPRLVTPPLSAPRATTPTTAPTSTQRLTPARRTISDSRSQRRSRREDIAGASRIAAATAAPRTATHLAVPVSTPDVVRPAPAQTATAISAQPLPEDREPLRYDSPATRAPTAIAETPAGAGAASLPADGVSAVPVPASEGVAGAAAPTPAFSTAASDSVVVPISSDRLSGIDLLLAQADELPVPPAPRPKVEVGAKASLDTARSRKAAAAKATAEAKKLADKKLADKKLRDEKAAIGLSGIYWVQLAGGGNADRMGFEYKRLAAKSSALKKRGGAVTEGKEYFRLLTGPFASRSEAQAFVNQLAKDDVDGFTWTRAPATIKIEKLPAK